MLPLGIIKQEKPVLSRYLRINGWNIIVWIIIGKVEVNMAFFQTYDKEVLLTDYPGASFVYFYYTGMTTVKEIRILKKALSTRYTNSA